jgi:myo-inositol-1(or 4)-monophosphatase
MRETLVECATSAGGILMERFGRVREIRFKEDRSSIVTEADLASERHILARLQAQYPHDNIIAEETGFLGRGGDRTWVIDPLDGTSNFAAGIPWFGVMITVLEQATPVLAAMYLPVEQTLYVSARGAGVQRNGRPVRVTAETDLRNTLCAHAMDAASDPDVARWRALLHGRLIQGARNLRATNSLVDFAYVIDGRFGAVVNHASKIWDIAASALMLPEAGGTLTDLRGQEVELSPGAPGVARTYAVVGSSRALLPQLLAQLSAPGDPASP